MTRTRALGAVVLVAALAATPCASVTINKVLADPSRYRDHDVALSGEVVESYSVRPRAAPIG